MPRMIVLVIRRRPASQPIYAGQVAGFWGMYKDADILIAPKNKVRLASFDTMDSKTHPFSIDDFDSLAEARLAIAQNPGFATSIVAQSSQTVLKGYVFDDRGILLDQAGSI